MAVREHECVRFGERGVGWISVVAEWLTGGESGFELCALWRAGESVCVGSCVSGCVAVSARE